MDQLDIAIHRTAHQAPGGLEALARRMGVNPQVLRNKVNPNSESHKLSLREAVAMMLLTGDHEILEVIARDLGYELVRRERPARPLIRAALEAAAEHGDVERAVMDALGDGRVTPREAAAIRRAIEGAIRALHAVADAAVRASEEES